MADSVNCLNYFYGFSQLTGKDGAGGYERRSVNCVSFITGNEQKLLLKYAKIVKMVMLHTETPIAGKSF
ncbi:hypothetical protein CEE39_08285 [bacterium (candidate division B38) B3_B38]|nr:MAG: hypothetical protein CEE39_08285 [bacterium (candidate division B38) B3_B38]